MSYFVLRAEENRMVRRLVTVKPMLRAYRCDACGLVFKMHPIRTDSIPGTMYGIFDQVNHELGNMFSANVCSFACADFIYAKQGWKKMEKYAAYVESGAELLRVSLMLTNTLKTEQQLIDEWHSLPKNADVESKEYFSDIG